ncbi:MAG TPA: 2-hydroxyacyl-CoA dehydratase family protein [Candidatus Binatia bacterium]|jgi:benzoyl-CoA reductase subunit B|nr:2-hydroxyacyl-CoA dehydratase family protein [Candidatus Binatia bacterium]
MPATVTERQYQGRVHEHSRRLMSEWMAALGRAEAEGVPTAALMISGNCVELLRACHLLPMFPEVTALQNAIRRKSLPLILRAEQAGYSSDNCAYVKADVGLFLEGGMGPGKPIPFPTLVVCNYVGCNVYVKWFEHLADISGAPLFMLDVPFARTPEPSPNDVQYVVTQLRELIALCESITGRRFDIDELREILHHAAWAEEGYARAKHLTKHHPAPFDAYFDSINMMGPINVLRGTPEAAEFFDAAVGEFEALAGQGLGPLTEERFRTVIEGPPPYPYYKNFRNLFTRWGAVAVQSTYSTVGGIWEWGFRHDPRRPLESIAEQMLRENLTNRSITARYQQIRRYVEEWEADALVIHSIKSCRLFSAGQGDMRDYFTRELGVPTLLVESDLEDPRYYAEAQLRNRIDAFFEALEHKKLTAAAR